jgi:hypothetical protein
LEFSGNLALTRTSVVLVGIFAGVVVLAAAERFSSLSQGGIERDSPESVSGGDRPAESPRPHVEIGNGDEEVAYGPIRSFIAPEYPSSLLPETTLTARSAWMPSEYRAIGQPLDAELAGLAAVEIAPVAIGEPLDADSPDWDAWKGSDVPVVNLGEDLDVDASFYPTESWAEPVSIGEPLDADAWGATSF